METKVQGDAALLDGRRQTLLTGWTEAKEHARQHEAQRATATNMLLLLASADIGAMATLGFGSRSIPLAIGLTILGLFGFLLSAKYYERYQRSVAVAYEIQSRLEELDPDLGWRAASWKGEDWHNKNYPKTSRLRLNKLWSYLHLVVISAGVAATVVSLASHWR